MSKSDPRSLSVNFSHFSSNARPAQIKSIIGDVRTSILTEKQFNDEVGLGWTLADGRSVEGTPYHAKTGNANVPDMRGSLIKGHTEGEEDLQSDRNIITFKNIKINKKRELQNVILVNYFVYVGF